MTSEEDAYTIGRRIASLLMIAPSGDAPQAQEAFSLFDEHKEDLEKLPTFGTLRSAIRMFRESNKVDKP